MCGCERKPCWLDAHHERQSRKDIGRCLVNNTDKLHGLFVPMYTAHDSRSHSLCLWMCTCVVVHSPNTASVSPPVSDNIHLMVKSHLSDSVYVCVRVITETYRWSPRQQQGGICFACAVPRTTRSPSSDQRVIGRRHTEFHVGHHVHRLFTAYHFPNRDVTNDP